MPIDRIVQLRNRNRTCIPVQIGNQIVHNGKVAAAVSAEFRIADNFVLDADFFRRTRERAVGVLTQHEFILFQLPFDFTDAAHDVQISVCLRRAAHQRERTGRAVFERRDYVLSVYQVPKVVVRASAVDILL